jgi:hypothetical protein
MGSSHRLARQRALDELRRLAHARDLVAREPTEECRKVRDTPLAPALHDTAPLRRRMQPVDAAVVRVALAAHETVGLERLHDPRHRRRPHLLGGRELTGRPRPAEDEHGQRRQLRRRDARRRILAADMAERVDGRRVEAVSRID